MSALLRPLRSPSTPTDRVLTLIVLAGAASVSFALAVLGPDSLVLFILVALGSFALAVLFVSPRYEISLAIFATYISAIDGYLKLKSGAQYATLGRDALLYAIAFGAFIRMGTSRAVRVPPKTGWVALFVAVCVVQIFNPAVGSRGHALAGLRPHLEFVPLFFFGYATMRTSGRIRAFLVLMLALTAINGVVALYQYQLTPDQLAGWGPGYQRLIAGGEGVGARVSFAAVGGDPHVRPFGLGSDIGFSGNLAALAVPAVLALLGIYRHGRSRIAVGLLSAFVAIALVASQARVTIIAAAFALIAFLALSTFSQRRVRFLLGFASVAVVFWLVLSIVSNNVGAAVFSRYQSIAPSQVFSTVVDYKSGSYAAFGDYASKYPLGAGIGKTGPASGFVGGSTPDLNAENQFNFLLLDIGLPGLIVLLAFSVQILFLAVTRVRRIADPQLRTLLIAVTASFIAVIGECFGAPVLAAPPGAPFFWFAAGILVYWCGESRARPRGQVLNA